MFAVAAVCLVGGLEITGILPGFVEFLSGLIVCDLSELLAKLGERLC